MKAVTSRLLEKESSKQRQRQVGDKDKDKDSRETKSMEEQQVERGSDGEPWSCLVEKGGGRGNDGAG